MTNATETVFQAALQLPDRDRAELAAKLIESIDPDTDADWAETWDVEIAKRVAELEEGKVQTVLWSEVRRRMVESKK